MKFIDLTRLWLSLQIVKHFKQIKRVAGDPSFLILHLRVVQFTIDLHTQYGARDIVNSSEY